MIFPEIIGYLLTLKYPGSESERMNWVCYRGGSQAIVPVVPPGTTLSYTARPPSGVYALLAWATRFGRDMVPNSFTGTLAQYGAVPYSGTISQWIQDEALEYLILVTEQEPMQVSVTNISPLAQRFETITDFIVIPTPQNLAVIIDALRRLHTSQVSEQLLQQAVSLLSVLAGGAPEPRPPIGGRP